MNNGTNFFAWLKRKEVRVRVIRFVIFAALVALATGYVFNTHFLGVLGPTVLAILLGLLALVTFVWAGQIVVRTFMIDGAGIVLMLNLAQMYCASPHGSDSNQALSVLLWAALIVFGFDLVRKVFQEVMEHKDSVTRINAGKLPWVYLVPFGLFIVLFMWDLWEVIHPIMSGLCIYR